jgi:SAM-dependent methyltransferase
VSAAAATPPGQCLACGAASVVPALDLGLAPPANLLTPDRDTDVPSYPLALMACPVCGHGQLSHFMAPEALFSHYLYASGTSGTLNAYFAWFRDQIAAAYPCDRRVLEIACNDGSLLSLFAASGYRTLGVDPAHNLAAQSRAKGLEIVEAFWPCPAEVAGRFDLIIAMNVAAHTPDPLSFMTGVREALAPGGVAFIQTSQALMLDNGEFDTIYHEHYSFYTERSFAALAHRAGLVLARTALTDIHGVSSVFMVTHPGDAPPPGLLDHGAFALADGDPVARHRRLLGTPEQYAAFAAQARVRMEEVRQAAEAARSEGRAVGFVGAAAKSLTFLHASGVRPDHLYDEAPLKIDRWAPGLGLQIEPLDAIAEVEAPMLVVLSAWNFAAELARKTRMRRPDRGDRFLVYFPALDRFD